MNVLSSRNTAAKTQSITQPAAASRPPKAAISTATSSAMNVDQTIRATVAEPGRHVS